jgi:ABC-type transport system involved in multi-copper enzyme maturation permease subunit
VAYVFLVIFLLMAGFLTFTIGRFFERAEASLVSFFTWHPWMYLFLVPAVGMRLWSEERRLGTLELLLTLPVTLPQVIIAKFLASWIFLAIALALTCPIWITVNVLGSPDNGAILTAYVGSLLLAGSFLAITSMTSAMTRNQAVSFILSVTLCLALVIATHGKDYYTAAAYPVMFIFGAVPVACSASSAVSRLAMEPFMSAVPRPNIQPRSTAPLNGLPCRQRPETGTTS